MRRLMIALLPLALATACAETEPPASAQTEPVPAEIPPEGNLGLTGLPLAEEIVAGHEIADDQCARCHGLDQEPPRRPDAPALRHVLSDYDSEALKESFRDGIKVGHPDMPEFMFDPRGADLLLSYLVSIQEPEGE